MGWYDSTAQHSSTEKNNTVHTLVFCLRERSGKKTGSLAQVGRQRDREIKRQRETERDRERQRDRAPTSCTIFHSFSPSLLHKQTPTPSDTTSSYCCASPWCEYNTTNVYVFLHGRSFHGPRGTERDRERARGKAE